MKDIRYTDMNGITHEAPEGTVPEIRTSVYGIVIHLGRVLMVRDAGATRWSLPGGKLEPGESYAECVEREGREETGHPILIPGRGRVDVAMPEGFRFEPDDRWFWSVKLYFRGELADPLAELRPQSEHEIEEAAWITLWKLDETPMSESDRQAVRRAQYGP